MKDMSVTSTIATLIALKDYITRSRGHGSTTAIQAILQNNPHVKVIVKEQRDKIQFEEGRAITLRDLPMDGSDPTPYVLDNKTVEYLVELSLTVIGDLSVQVIKKDSALQQIIEICKGSAYTEK